VLVLSKCHGDVDLTEAPSDIAGCSSAAAQMRHAAVSSSHLVQNACMKLEFCCLKSVGLPSCLLCSNFLTFKPKCARIIYIGNLPSYLVDVACQVADEVGKLRVL